MTSEFPFGSTAGAVALASGAVALTGCHMMFEDALTTGVNQMALTPRPDLLESIGAAMDQAYAISIGGEYMRCMEDKAPLDVVVCLGSGRCLYPTSGSETRHCPFCKVLPGGFAGQCAARESLRQNVMGH